jgi:hypothetical protein
VKSQDPTPIADSQNHELTSDPSQLYLRAEDLFDGGGRPRRSGTDLDGEVVDGGGGRRGGHAEANDERRRRRAVGENRAGGLGAGSVQAKPRSLRRRDVTGGFIRPSPRTLGVVVVEVKCERRSGGKFAGAASRGRGPATCGGNGQLAGQRPMENGAGCERAGPFGWAVYENHDGGF